MLMSFVVKEKFGGEDLLLGKSFILVGKCDCLVGNLPVVDETLDMENHFQQRY